jgi:hypothetical protein
MDAKHQTPAEAMGPHEQPAPHPPIPPGTIAYEKTDTDPGSIVRVAAVLIAISVLATVIAFFLFRALGTREARQDPAPPHLARPDDGGLPPEPRLQTAPADELLAVRTEEHLSLSGYGWVDEAGGVARIPIEEAMALYAARARGSADAPAASPVAAPPAAASPSAPVRR